jgi:hypothetical protein
MHGIHRFEYLIQCMNPTASLGWFFAPRKHAEVVAMIEVTWATPLYEFLRLCSASRLEKKVLDCGAGGDRPPLSLFHQYGYASHGVEIAPIPLAQARQFTRLHAMDLHLIRGDMRHLPYSDASFSFVYSFNAIFFMTKAGVAHTMSEIMRVLRRDGLCYVNFLSIDDPDESIFCDTAPCKDLLGSKRFSKHEDDEADVLFRDYDVLRKEKRLIEKAHAGGTLVQAYVEYIAQKR